MRKGFRVLVTDRCNMNCPTCFNRRLRTDREMPLLDFTRLCAYLKNEGNISRLKIMGGEPTTHTQFAEVVNVAKSMFDSIHIFTNGINDEIGKISLRERDTVIYNLACMGEDYPAAKLQPGAEFVHAFETRIDANADVERIKRVLSHVFEVVGESAVVNLTLDCTDDIFAHRDAIVRNWNAVVDFLKDEQKVDFRVDHGIPVCFSSGMNMNLGKGRSLCLLDCAGLVTPQLQLRHCNQTADTLLHLCPNGEFVPWRMVEQYLLCDNLRKKFEALRRGCRNCMVYGEKCDGGCFAFKSGVHPEPLADCEV